jgi:hypothetical protein
MHKSLKCQYYSQQAEKKCYTLLVLVLSKYIFRSCHSGIVKLYTEIKTLQQEAMHDRVLGYLTTLFHLYRL